MRTFRVDRMRRAAISKQAAVPPPEGFDAVAYVSRSLARTPWRHEVEVLLDLTLEQATRRLPATLAELAEAEDGTLLRMRVGSLDWTARILAGLDCSFTILQPAELRASVQKVADRLAASAA
jgi:predicted DNA-binding transcriptional regulator YafY